MESPQAKWATKWLRDYDKYEDIKKMFVGSSIKVKALVAEIICPISKVVVPYDFEGLVLIAGQISEMVMKEGNRVRYMDHKMLSGLSESMGFPVCRKFTFDSLDATKDHLDVVEDFEGFVLHWPESGFRIKMKAEDYKRRHRILSSIHPNRVDEAIVSKKHEDLDDVLKSVEAVLVEFPEEYVKPYEDAVQKWAKECFQAGRDIVHIVSNFSTPKALALHLKSLKEGEGKEFADQYFSHIMNYYRGKADVNKFSLSVWQQVRKEHFNEIEEE
jgi:hypothetical protein